MWVAAKLDFDGGGFAQVDLDMEECLEGLFDRDPETGQMDSLATVLLQEIDRFNGLLANLRESLVLLRKAIIALLPAMLPGATPQTLYLCATCAFFFAILAHALLLPYSVPYAVTAQCELVSLLCSFAVFACCFFREGLAATSENPAAAKETDGVAIAIVVMTAFALWFFHAMHKLVAILENDGGRSSAISWADIQTYFRYSLIPTKGAGIIRNLRYQKRVAPLRGPALYKREDAEQIEDDRERRSRKGAQA